MINISLSNKNSTQCSFGHRLTKHVRERLEERPVQFSDMKNILRQPRAVHFFDNFKKISHHFGLTCRGQIAEIVQGDNGDIITVIIHNARSLMKKIETLGINKGKKESNIKKIIEYCCIN